MDTRTKIVSEEEARGIARRGGVICTSGHFDPLLAEHAEGLRALSQAGKALIVTVANPSAPVLSQRARAELVAALKCVDYVVMSGAPGPTENPEHERIARRFIAHVLQRYSGSGRRMSGPSILVVRLGAMGDIIHTLPAIASLKHGIAYSRIAWVIEPRWTALLDGNPYVERVIAVDRHSFSGLRHAWKSLRAEHFDFVVDFQGLAKSALVAAFANAERIFGFRDSRERAAKLFYSAKVRTDAVHMVDQNLDLAAAAGASSLVRSFPIPEGRPEGELPEGDFVLASPRAGWGAKQWPLEYYAELGRAIRRETGMMLVLNGKHPLHVEHTQAHVSGLPGLIWATRRAAAVVGLDSGPLHLAAALGKPGVAIYGPTDPARNGPYASALIVLRAPGAETTHRRASQPADSMRGISAQAVFEALKPALALHSTRPS